MTSSSFTLYIKQYSPHKQTKLLRFLPGIKAD
jgi:hypothetical protein